MKRYPDNSAPYKLLASHGSLGFCDFLVTINRKMIAILFLSKICQVSNKIVEIRARLTISPVQMTTNKKKGGLVSKIMTKIQWIYNLRYRDFLLIAV